MISLLDNSISIIHTIPLGLPHEMTSEGLLLSRKNKLYLIDNLSEPREKEIGSIPWDGMNFLGHLRFVDRVCQYSIQQALSVSGKGYFIFNQAGWWFLKKGKSIAEKLVVPMSGRPMARSICRAVDGTIYFAEYKSNHLRGRIRIYKTTDLYDYKLAFEFSPFSIRHIHAIIQDPCLDKRLWVLTGDYDHESSFYYTDDQFEHLNSLPCLGQRTRATSIGFDGDHQIVWGMDSPLAAPSILCWGPDYSKEPKVLASLPGPAYYMASNAAGGMYLGTTVEPGPSVVSSCATLWARKMDKSWFQVGEFQTDVFPQYAIIYFPREPLPENYVVFSLRAVKGLDGRLFIAKDMSF